MRARSRSLLPMRARPSASLRKSIEPSYVLHAHIARITGTSVCVDNGQHLVPLPRDIMFVVDELLKNKESELLEV